MSARRRNVGPASKSKMENPAETSLISERTNRSLSTEEVATESMINKDEQSSSSGGSGLDDTDEEQLIHANGDITASTVDGITEGELWYELEKELQKHDDTVTIHAVEEVAAAAKEIIEEENQLADAAENSKAITTSDDSDNHHFYPPGRIMHIVSVPSSTDGPNSNSDDPANVEEHVCLYETPRELYSKLRLSRKMINDHYMPMYEKMMELLIQELEKDNM